MKLTRTSGEPEAKKTHGTRPFVWIALVLNLVLLLAAFILPRRVATTGAESASQAILLFVIPMVLVLVIGFATAIWSYILARRAQSAMPWVAFLPLVCFVVGVALALGAAFSQAT